MFLNAPNYSAHNSFSIYPTPFLKVAGWLILYSLLLLFPFQAFGILSMETGDKAFILDSPGGAGANRGESAPSGDGWPHNNSGNGQGDILQTLPWGLVPEVYIPWLPGGGIRPPHKPGTKPPYGPGGKPGYRPGQKPVTRPHSEYGPGKPAPYLEHPGKSPHGQGPRKHRSDTSSNGPHDKTIFLLGAYGPGGAFLGVGGGNGLNPSPGGARPISSGISGRAPGELPSSLRPGGTSGFTDKAPTGAPERRLYPGMRPPLPGNTPQPVYPGEKPYAPGAFSR